jgi:hypothetical protein
MRSRAVTLALTALLIGGTTAGGIASQGGGGGNAADSQYRPGKGCGDKNHIHARHDECKDKGGHGNGHG